MKLGFAEGRVAAGFIIIIVSYLLAGLFVMSCGGGGSPPFSEKSYDMPDDGGFITKMYVAGETAEGELEFPDETELALCIRVVADENAIGVENLEAAGTEYSDGRIEVVISAQDAGEVQSGLFELRFDQAKYRPVSFAVGDFFRDDTDGESGDAAANGSVVLDVALFDEEGRAISMMIPASDHVGIGIARIRPDENGLVSGSGKIATVVFKPGAYEPKPSSVKEPMQAAPAPEHFWDWQYGTILPRGTSTSHHASVLYCQYMPGDTNNDREVTVADITPIAVYYLEELEWYPPIFTSFAYLAHTEERGVAISCADLDRNGEVGIADISGIAEAYYKKYYPYDLAVKTDSGSWTPVRELTDGNYTEYRPPSYGDGHSYWYNIKLSPETEEYGIPYVMQPGGKIGALPLAYQELDSLNWDNYLEGVRFEDNWLMFDMQLFGDFDANGFVEISDLIVISNYYPTFDDDQLIHLGRPMFFEDFRKIADYNANGICDYLPINETVLLLQSILLNYYLEIEKFHVEFFDSPDATVPFETQERSLSEVEIISRHFIGFREQFYRYRPDLTGVSGTVYVEAYAVLNIYPYPENTIGEGPNTVIVRMPGRVPIEIPAE
ncbi:hypothetical protein J7K50_01750 [bacterium]|nr:hypothetical protein [bacterium]